MGIDPGLDGAIVVWEPGETTPRYSARLKTLLEDKEGLLEVLWYYRPCDYSSVVRCALEAIPNGHPGMRGTRSALTMGRNWGYLRGILDAFGYDVVEPAPKKWMRMLPEGEGKSRSIEAAQKLMPGIDLYHGKVRKPHDGLADAACLAYYAWSTRND
jgi:crossover junction endodeoxyribonuclease RuvC